MSQNPTLSQKIKYIVTHITVEPLIFFYILPGTMGFLATQNLNLEKACRVNLNYNATICDSMIRGNREFFTDFQETEVQTLVAKMLTVKTAIVGFFPACLLLFYGSWSDRYNRRKPVILIPIFGDVVSYVCLFFCAYFFLELSVEYSTLADALPFSLGGGPPCIALGIYSYVSGLGDEKDRTLRIGAVSMFQNVAIAVGNALGGVLIKPLSYEGVYLLTTGIMLTAFVYGYFIIRDTNKIEVKYSLSDFFNVNHVKKTFEICFKDDKNDRRRRMIVMLFLSVMIMGPFYGELSVLYLYTRIKFGWDEVNYSVYNTLQFLVQICGSVFALSFFTKYLELSDATLGIIAMFSKISACLIYAFSPTGTSFIFGAFFEIFHGTAHIAMRSMISKMVPVHELGQSTSVFGVFEAMLPLIFGPFYTTLYNYTLRVFPGTFYLVSAGLYVVTLYLFWWFYKNTGDMDHETVEGKLMEEYRLEKIGV